MTRRAFIAGCGAAVSLDSMRGSSGEHLIFREVGVPVP